MQVAQWSIIKSGAKTSGLSRYDYEINKECSKYLDVRQFSTRENKIKTLSYFNKNRGQVTHITTQQYALLRPVLLVKNCVLTVHDLIQETCYSPGRKVSELWYFCRTALPYFEKYIVDATFTKFDLMRRFNVSEEKITVIPLGVDHKLYRPIDKEKARNFFNLDLDKNYLLGFSSGAKWKNTQLFSKLKGDFEVIDAGYSRGKFGYINEVNLPLLYAACDIFLAPSIYEGFCLPVIESMACGVPCIVSDRTALPETLGSGGLKVDPFDPEEWENAIYRILSGKMAWKNRAIRQANKFSWKKTGIETANVYRGMLNEI